MSAESSEDRPQGEEQQQECSEDKDTTPEANGEAHPPAVAKCKHRHDWYQTEVDVCINILIKKVKKDNVHVDFQERKVCVKIDLEGDEYNLSLALSNPVNASKCSIKVYGTKVELRMRKCECLHWTSLESESNAPKLKLPKDVSAPSGPGPSGEQESVVHKYPSSSHYTRDWDKLAEDVKKEEKEEKPEGDAALNKLFQQIYTDGNDEVRKAMNKSFMESGGTVLSTNWGDIGKGKVERKPPDGMEWKDYEK